LRPALNENYAVSNQPQEDGGKENAPKSSKGSPGATPSRHPTYPIPHTITRFTNKLKPRRRSSLPLPNPWIATPNPYQQRGFGARSPTPGTSQPPFRNVTNARLVAEPESSVTYEACIVSLALESKIFA
jgi:hypothetical protein